MILSTDSRRLRNEWVLSISLAHKHARQRTEEHLARIAVGRPLRTAMWTTDADGHVLFCNECEIGGSLLAWIRVC